MPLQQTAAVSHLTYFFNSFNLSFKQQKQHTTTIFNTTKTEHRCNYFTTY